MGLLGRISSALGRIRNGLDRDVEIRVLELRRVRTMKKKDLPKRAYKGVVIESDIRKIIDIGSSIGATMPESQAYAISKGAAFQREFILLENEEQIMVYTQIKEHNDHE